MTETAFANHLVDWLGSESAVLAGAFMAAALISYFVVRRVVVRLISAALERTPVRWDDALIERGVFTQFAFLAPALILIYGLQFFPDLAEIGRRVLLAYVAVNIVIIVDRLLSAGLDVYQQYPLSRRRPIKGYMQLAKMALYILGGVFAVCTLLDVSPWGILSGLGALTAVLILVFKDTIMSLIASIQIAAYDLVQKGDWIEMPQYGADGDVIDVALHTVKVQNWDKTIVTIPTHKLVEDSFKNWRGMTDSGGRRIKRSLLIDQSSVRFCDDALLKRLRGVERLKPYLDAKEEELASANAELGDDLLINRRALTNLGTFRAYVEAYLRDNRYIHKGMTFLVRQLAPTPDGLPLEIYVFTNDTDWGRYEAIQADIFDHLLAAIPTFDLRLFQHPTGHDFNRLAGPAA